MSMVGICFALVKMSNLIAAHVVAGVLLLDIFAKLFSLLAVGQFVFIGYNMMSTVIMTPTSQPAGGDDAVSGDANVAQALLRQRSVERVFMGMGITLVFCALLSTVLCAFLNEAYYFPIYWIAFQLLLFVNAFVTLVFFRRLTYSLPENLTSHLRPFQHFIIIECIVAAICIVALSFMDYSPTGVFKSRPYFENHVLPGNLRWTRLIEYFVPGLGMLFATYYFWLRLPSDIEEDSIGLQLSHETRREGVYVQLRGHGHDTPTLAGATHGP